MRQITFAFDLDGTLVHTAPDLVHATNHTLASLDIPPAPSDVITSAVSHGAAAMIKAALAHHNRKVPAEQFDGLLETFLAHYAENIAAESRPYPGVAILLERLVDIGARITVCTNKREALSRKLLNALDLAKHCHAIVGRDTLPICKPDPGHLIGAIILADGNPNKAIMVGDSEVDIRTAQRAGIPVVGVTFGYSPEPIATYNPDATIDNYGQLEAAVQMLSAQF